MDANQLEKKIEELAKPVLLQDRQNKIIKNLHLIIFKFIIICATIAIIASFAYTRITRKNSTELADILLMFLLLIFFLFVLILKSPKVRKWFSKEIYKGTDD
jgi:uncharacterized membrane protein